MNKTNRRSAIQIMGQLIGLVKPLLIFMIAAILLGTAGSNHPWNIGLFMCNLPDYPCRAGSCSWTYSTIILSYEKSTSCLYAC